MSSVPYPSFSVDALVDAKKKGLALEAVGRCRLRLTTGNAEFASVVAKNAEQASVNLDGNDKDEQKKLQKKFMKEGVAMAKELVNETFQLDTSVIDVEVFVSAEDLLRTNGCLAACLLDAGCKSIVTDGTNMSGMDMAKLPRERLIAHFDYSRHKGKPKEFVESIKAASTLCFGVSVELSDPKDANQTTIAEILNYESTVEEDLEVVVSFHPTMTNDELAMLVSSVRRKEKHDHDKGSIALINPTVEQLGTTFVCCMRTDRDDGLFTTVVCSRTGEALGLVYSSKESVVAALECGRGVYYSRSRNGLWRKGDTSGNFQTLHRLDIDCDGDALRFTVTQRGKDKPAFCHLGTYTCWGDPRGLSHLQETLQHRMRSAPEGSYTKRLFDDSELLRNKLVEEAQELSEATTPADVAGELADVLYFAMVRAVAAGVTIDDAVAVLDNRSRKVTRRKGDSKASRIEAANQILEKK